MTARDLRIAAACVGLFALAACGTIRGPSSGCVAAACAPAQSPSTGAGGQVAATAQDHGWTTTASINSANHTIDISVRVPGPLTVEGGCVPSVVAWAVGPNNTRVEASPTPGARCYAITVDDVPEGQTGSFATSIPLPPAGTYAIHGLLRTHLPLGAGMRVSENLPVVTVTVP